MINIKPDIAKNDLTMLLKYIKNCKTYFEFGSGGSTNVVSQLFNLKKIYSVESDYRWYNKVKQILKKEVRLNLILIDLKCKENGYGYPGDRCKKETMIEYSNQIKKVESPDLIFIDGRFRVACCLKTFECIDNSLIAFDDFLGRKHYHEVLKYFDIVEKTSDCRMVILKKKNNVKYIPKKIIEKYELDPR